MNDRPWNRLRLGRSLAAGVVAAAVMALAWGVPSVGSGQGAAGSGKAAGKAGEKPENDLLRGAPFDRITLPDDTVFLIEPVSPRPLPAYDASKDRARAEQAAPKPEAAPKPAAKGAAGKAGGRTKKAANPPGEPAPRKAAPARSDPANEVIIHLMEGEIRDYRVRRSSIKKIEYFEDILLAEADRLMQLRDFPRAFEHLLAARNRDPKWPGLAEHVDRLLYEEGSWALLENDRERGMLLLRELNGRQPNYPGLADKLAVAYVGRVGEAFDKGEYGYARRVLHDLRQVAPRARAVGELTDRFVAKAKAVADDAMKKQGGDRLDGLAEALRIWPKLDAAAGAYEEAFKALPTLDVGVTDLARPVAPWVRTPAAQRIAPLVYLPILADEGEEAVQGKKANQIAAGLEVGELGRRLTIRLRRGPSWSDGSRGVAAIDVVRALADRAHPRSPAYSARWADILDRVEAAEDQVVALRLNRAILRPEAWLIGPVGPAHAGWDGRVPGRDGRRRSVGDGPFVWESAGDETTTLRAAAAAEGSADPNAEPVARPKIQRLREVRLPSASAALGALVRGEVSLVEHVPPDRIAALTRDESIQVGRYTRPALHRLALDGRHPAMRSRSLRRAISYAIDRRTLLEENLLKRPIDEANAPSDGPFAKGTYADATDVKPFTYDPLLAKMLVAGARKELGGIPIRLTFEYPAQPEAQVAAPRIAEALRAAGLEIELVERPESELEDALRSGRKFGLAYRISKCVEPIWEAGPMLCPGYDAPPGSDGLAALCSARVLQLLLQLEHAPDFNAARALVTQIDRECRDELPVIPLWQLRDHYAWRARVKGPGEAADTLYQGIEKWEVEPWFARDPW